MAWDTLLAKLMAIKYYLEIKNNSLFYSLGDIMLMLENSFIGNVDATEKDYHEAVEEFWECENNN